MTVPVVLAIGGALCIVLMCLTACLLMLLKASTPTSKPTDTAHSVDIDESGYVTHVLGLKPKPKPSDLNAHADVSTAR